MKSTLALFLGILMLAGSLFPQTDVEEVYKLPGLIEHYQLHKKAAGDGFDFWQFLDLHYNTASKHAKTPHKGVRLPMYNHLSAGFVFILTQLQWRPDSPSRAGAGHSGTPRLRQITAGIFAGYGQKSL